MKYDLRSLSGSHTGSISSQIQTDSGMPHELNLNTRLAPRNILLGSMEKTHILEGLDCSQQDKPYHQIILTLYLVSPS